MPTDLTAARSLTAANGERVLEVQTQTLAAGERLLGTWGELEPIVKQLITLVRAEVEAGNIEKPASLLSQCAVVVQKLGQAATGVLKASEGMAKLGLILSAGQAGARRLPAEMTQAELSGVVLETARKIWTSGQPCPVCKASHPIEVPPAAAEVTPA